MWETLRALWRELGREPAPELCPDVGQKPRLFDWEREQRFPFEEEPPKGPIAIVGSGRGQEVELPPRWTHGPIRPL